MSEQVNSSEVKGRIYGAGFVAGHEGKTRSACPWAIGSNEERMWINGWSAGLAQWLQERTMHAGSNS